MDGPSGPDLGRVDEAVETLARIWAMALAEALRPLLRSVIVDDRPGPQISERDLPSTLSVAQAATVLGLSRAATYEAVRREELPSVRIGRRILIPTARLAALLGA